MGFTCLTETKWNEVRENVFRNLAKDYWIFCKHRKGIKDNDDGSGGVAILVKKDLDWDREPVPIEGVGEVEGVIRVSVYGTGERYNIGGFYVPPSTSDWAITNELVWERDGGRRVNQTPGWGHGGCR